jgi:hypothetical protein
LSINPFPLTSILSNNWSPKNVILHFSSKKKCHHWECLLQCWNTHLFVLSFSRKCWMAPVGQAYTGSHRLAGKVVEPPPQSTGLA